MAVSFNNIPSNIRVPLFYAEVDASRAGYFQLNNRSLLIGQKLAAGTAAANVPIFCSNQDAARLLCGVGSMLERMVGAYRANDAFGELWILPLDDAGAGVQATGTVTFTGPATAAGTINLYIAGQRVQVAVNAADTATVIATAVVAAITANTSLPVTATSAAGVVTLTAKHRGEVGNDIQVQLNYLGNLGGEALPAGVAATIVAMTSGATNPVLTTAITNLGDEVFDYVIHPYTDTTSLNALQAYFNDTTGNWSYLKQTYGGGFSARRGTVAALQTFGAGRNDQHMSVLGYGGSPTPVYEVAAMYGAQCAKSLSIDPARPLQTLPLIGMLPAPMQSRFTVSERNTLLFTGVATQYVEGGTVRIERAVTNYRQNTFGQADPSYLDVETLFTLAYILRNLKFRITQKFPRHKLANDGTRFGDGQAIVTPKIIRAELLACYAELENLGLVENREAFAQNLIVERSATDPNRVDVLLPPDLVNQLRIFAVLAQFRLNY
jgi:phage tail sheath gpL-like